MDCASVDVEEDKTLRRSISDNAGTPGNSLSVRYLDSLGMVSCVLKLARSS